MYPLENTKKETGIETEHDELNQNLLCESLNEDLLKPAIK
jgi:hypothetical protein